MAEYVLEFLTLTVGRGSNEQALKTAFCQGLNLEVPTEMASWGDKMALDSLIELTIRLDHLLPANTQRKLDLITHE